MEYKVLSIKYILRIFFLVILYTCLSTLNTKLVHAENVNLRAYPSLIQIKAPTFSELNANVTVENLTENSVRIDTQIRLFKPSDAENGEIEYQDPATDPDQILKKIHLFDGENAITGLTLGPNQKRQLKVQISLKENEPQNDYYFSVIFINKPKIYESQSDSKESSQNSFSTIDTGVASNILVSVGSQNSDKNSGSIEEFSSPKSLEKGPLPFTIKIHNNGSKYFTTKGIIYIKNMFGQTVGKIDLPSQNILSNSSRYLSNQTLQTPTYNLHPQVIWKEKFLLGFYEARLSLEAQGNTPITRSIRFFVFPAKFIAGSIVCLLLVLLISKRVKQKMSL